MWKVTVVIQQDNGFRASEIIADLRNAAETLFHPLKLVGFWDSQADGMHICPQEARKKECPHRLPSGDPRRVDYAQTVEEEMDGRLEVSFPHAGVQIYLK